METQGQTAKMLKELPDLRQQALDIPEVWLYHADELEKAGMVTKEELVTLKKAIKAHDEINQTAREAEDSIPYPNTLPRFPEEYQQLLTKEKTLRDGDRQIHTVRSTLYELAMNDRMRLDSNYLAGKVKDILDSAPNPDYAELHTVIQSVERKSRAGTIVDKMRKEASDEYYRLRKEASARVTTDLEAKYEDLLIKEKRILALANRRRDEKLQPIRKQVTALLTKVLKEFEGK
jgi:hypothetical protein